MAGRPEADIAVSLTGQRLLRAGTILLSAVSAVLMFAVVWRVPMRFPFDPNEGWNAFHAASAFEGPALYPPVGSFYFNNYPPLSFYAVRSLGALLGDHIVAGRILAVASFACLLTCTALAASALGASRGAAAFGCAFLAAQLLVYSNYVGMNDPQMFGHALAATGLALVLRHPRRSLSVGMGAVLFACSVFVKPNLLALPLATFLWLMLWHKRSAPAFVLTGAGSATALLAFCLFLYGSGFPSHLLSPRGYSIDALWRDSLEWLTKASFLLPLGWLAARARRDEAASLCVIYTLASAAFGLYLLGGNGVDQNVLFDTYIAFAMGAAVSLDRAASVHPQYDPALSPEASSLQPNRTTGAARAAALLLAFLLPPAAWLLVKIDSGSMQSRYGSGSLVAAEAGFAQGIRFVRERQGRAVCQEQALCYWAGKAPEVDFFNFWEYLSAGRLDEGALLSEIRARQFAVIQLGASPADGSAWQSAMQGAYREARRDAWGVYFVPR